MTGMTVLQLRTALEGRADDLPVVIDSQSSEYDYASARRVFVESVDWAVDDEGEELEESTGRLCFVITAHDR